MDFFQVNNGALLRFKVLTFKPKNVNMKALSIRVALFLGDMYEQSGKCKGELFPLPMGTRVRETICSFDYLSAS